MVARIWVALGAVALLASGCRDQSGLHHDPDGGAPGDGQNPDPGKPVTQQCPPLCPGKPTDYARAPGPNPIPEENQKPGSPAWRSGRPANDGQVELYASVESAESGDTVGVKVSTDSEQQVTAEVYRFGDYGGAGARKLWQGGPFPAGKQAPCPRDPQTSRVECAWTDTFSFTVGADWVSGLYVVKVIRPDGFKRFTPLVVRDHRAAELLLQPGMNTYQAYNTWGGESLYSDGSGTMPSGRAFEVSYNRPYKDDEGTGQMLRYEYALARFLERNGYDVTYGSNLDFSRFTSFLDGVGTLVIGGHDEYWSQEERTQVDAAIASGGTSLVNLSGNGAYWRVRPISSQDGQGLRGIACFKSDSKLDPVPDSTIRFRDDPNALPESLLFGAMYDGWELEPFPLIVKDPDSWLFAGTGLQRGDGLVGLVGYEFDRVPDGASLPGLNVSMESPVVTAEGLPSVSQVVDRLAPSGRLVFSAGSIYWALGLSADPQTHDARLERMTLNVLERALSHRRPARMLPSATGPVPLQAAPDARWAASVSAWAGTPGTPGWVDGAGAVARFAGPTGLALTPEGRLVVADTTNNRIRMIDTDAARTVTTIAGGGQLGGRDGDGTAAMFRSPTGVAVGPDGAIYVADSDNHLIRRIQNNPPRWTVTTYAGALRVPGTADGPARVARFNRPTALAVDASGNLYVADQAGNRIRRISTATGEVKTIAGSGATGSADSQQGLTAQFNNPSALALSPTGEIYVMDAGNQRVRRVSADPAHAVVTIAGDNAQSAGFADGTGEEARFRAQMGMALGLHGELLLGDTANFRIREILPGVDSATTSVRTIAGTGHVGAELGRGDQADIVAPAGLALAPDGTLYVSDSYNGAIRAIRR